MRFFLVKCCSKSATRTRTNISRPHGMRDQPSESTAWLSSGRCACPRRQLDIHEEVKFKPAALVTHDARCHRRHVSLHVYVKLSTISADTVSMMCSLGGLLVICSTLFHWARHELLGCNECFVTSVGMLIDSSVWVLDQHENHLRGPL